MCVCCSLDNREEELQLQKRKKRKIKGNSRLSFADDIDNGSEEEDGENSKHFFEHGLKPAVCFKLYEFVHPLSWVYLFQLPNS